MTRGGDEHGPRWDSSTQVHHSREVEPLSTYALKSLHQAAALTDPRQYSSTPQVAHSRHGFERFNHSPSGATEAMCRPLAPLKEGPRRLNPVDEAFEKHKATMNWHKERLAQGHFDHPDSEPRHLHTLNLDPEDCDERVHTDPPGLLHLRRHDDDYTFHSPQVPEHQTRRTSRWPPRSNPVPRSCRAQTRRGSDTVAVPQN